MFYTGLSRVVDPKNMKVLNFNEKYIKCDSSAFDYEVEIYFIL